MTIWNTNKAKPVKSGLSRKRAQRIAAILERLFDTPYMVVS